MAGYSKRSLVQKLGLKEDTRIIIINPPEDYDKTLGELPHRVLVADTLAGPLDFIHFFTKDKTELAREFPRLKQGLAQAGVLWISWPKRACSRASGILATRSDISSSLPLNMTRRIFIRMRTR